MDVFVYSGPITRRDDLRFIKFIDANKKSDDVLLSLCTYGGDPDAAYKIGRYLQKRYSKINIIVSGFCKSAGTLLALAAHELVFTPYGELGPLDIQITKTDNIASLESGLNIRQAFTTLEERAAEHFHRLIGEIIGASGGVVSFQTAAHSAAEMVSGLYGPIFGRIDPEEVGSKSRAMQIAASYGQRLNAHSQNLKPNLIDYLAQTYPSHGFVIDLGEAEQIFVRVREATDHEKTLVDKVGMSARFPEGNLRMDDLTDTFAEITRKGENGQPIEGGMAPVAQGEPEDDEGNRGAAGQERQSQVNGADSAVG